MSVGIALGLRATPDCAAIDHNRDGTVTIAELITGVQRALAGCPAARTGARLHRVSHVASPA